MTAAIERASPTDLAFRAMGSGGVLQEQVGAVLLLGRGAGSLAVERAVAERMGAVPRLRQLVVAVPTGGPPADRLRRFAGTVRAGRAAASGPPLIATAGWLFRLPARAGLYRWWLRRQRRFHTLVSDVHGPDRPLTLAGAPVEAVLPLAVGAAGDVTVSFQALSYAGTLAVTVIADADAVRDLPVLVAALAGQFAQLVTSSAPAAST